MSDESLQPYLRPAPATMPVHTNPKRTRGDFAPSAGDSGLYRMQLFAVQPSSDPRRGWVFDGVMPMKNHRTAGKRSLRLERLESRIALSVSYLPDPVLSIGQVQLLLIGPRRRPSIRRQPPSRHPPRRNLPSLPWSIGTAISSASVWRAGSRSRAPPRRSLRLTARSPRRGPRPSSPATFPTVRPCRRVRFSSSAS